MSAGYQFYDTQMQRMDVLKEGAEVEIHVLERETMCSKAVRAKLSKSPDALENAERLHIYGRLGVPLPDTWYIQVLEELEEDELVSDGADVDHLLADMALKPSESFKKPRRQV
ncbi:MAG: hypothetical protein HY675_13315 [Chloroflexi bacterium]|nr:hypothetical protein [Chloroflexota bacterium]